MSRKPYHRDFPNDWFLRNAFYKGYIAREFSCIFIGLYAINLMAGVAALAISPLLWGLWLASQLNPVMVIMAVLAFVSSVFHTITWFQTMPKVIKIPKGDHFMPGNTIVAACYAATAIISLALLILVAVI